jgi:hypothetical protein
VTLTDLVAIHVERDSGALAHAAAVDGVVVEGSLCSKVVDMREMARGNVKAVAGGNVSA